MKTYSWPAVVLSLIVTSGGCATAPTPNRSELHASWHLVGERDDTRVGVFVQKVYVLVTNVGKEKVSLNWLEVNGTKTLGEREMKPGEITVIPMGELTCKFPTEVKVDVKLHGSLTYPVSTIPSNLPRGAERRCCWPTTEIKCPSDKN